MIKTILTLLLFCISMSPANSNIATEEEYLSHYSEQQTIKKRPLISIAVTEPNANAVWEKGKSYTIRWNKFGQLPGTVRIILSNPGGTELMGEIKDPAPNTGSFQWTIPMTIAAGSYKIMVRASNTQISDLSDEFRITAGLSARQPDLSTRTITVTKPRENRRYEPNAQVTIEWETKIQNYVLKTNNMLYFSIDIYDEIGAKRLFTITRKDKYDRYYLGGDKYRLIWNWSPDNINTAVSGGLKTKIPVSIKSGFRKIKITPILADGKQAGMPGFSKKIYLSRGSKKVTETLSPQIRDRYSRRRTASNYALLGPGVPEGYESQPGKARAGFNFDKDKTGENIVGADFKYKGFIFRSQITFPVDQHREPGKLLLKAWLYLTVEHEKLSHDRTDVTGFPQPNTCGRNLYYITSPWSGKCLSTPGNLITTLSDQKVFRVEVTQYVQNWYTGSEPNHGFLLGSIVEEFVERDGHCVSWYKPVLIIEFLAGK